MRVAITGAGWAGLAAAVSATEAGHDVTVFEASRAFGGRARALKLTLPNGQMAVLDNGQHILIGAYRQCQRLMRQVGLSPEDGLLDLPMSLRFPDGMGLTFPAWPSPLDALAGILGARGWSWRDKVSLLRTALGWQRQGFSCAPSLSVAALCASLTPRVMTELVEPLCVSALNTPPAQTSGAVFLRVLQDALFGASGASHLLLPRRDLSALFPDAADDWLRHHGARVVCGARVESLRTTGEGWQLHGRGMPPELPSFAAVILATCASNAALTLTQSAQTAPFYISNQMQDWAGVARALRFEAIATVYAWGERAHLPQPMLALRSDAACPAQFVFDRGQLGGPAGLLAFVVSAARGERLDLQSQVLDQANTQLGLRLQPVQTVVEKRATFACTPGMRRPPQQIAPGLLACGDYVEGPYPATLEGAVMSGLAAVQTLMPCP